MRSPDPSPAPGAQWIGNGYGWDVTRRAPTTHACSCGSALTQVGPTTKSGSALLECGTCNTTHHLIARSPA